MQHTQWFLMALIWLKTGHVLLDDMALEVARAMPLADA